MQLTSLSNSPFNDTPLESKIETLTISFNLAFPLQNNPFI